MDRSDPANPVSVGSEGTRWSDLTGEERKEVAAIYVTSFPVTARHELEYLYRVDEKIWLARAGGRVRGFAAAVLLDDVNVVLLQYMAVDADHRSTGIGSALLVALARYFETREGRIGGIVLEIEDPFADHATNIQRRRFDFYRRWGADRMTCLRRYFIADFVNPDRRIPMLLLWRPIADLQQPRGHRLGSILKSIYLSKYATVTRQGHIDDLLAQVIC